MTREEIINTLKASIKINDITAADLFSPEELKAALHKINTRDSKVMLLGGIPGERKKIL